MTMDELTKRYRLLLEEVGKEVREEMERSGKSTWGWKNEVYRRTGLKQSHGSRLLNHGRGPGKGAIAGTCAAMKLSSEYFYGKVTPRSYRDFLLSNRPNFRDFLKTEPAQRALTEHPEHLSTLEKWPSLVEPTVHQYGVLLAALIGSSVHSGDASPAVAAELNRRTLGALEEERKDRPRRDDPYPK